MIGIRHRRHKVESRIMNHESRMRIELGMKKGTFRKPLRRLFRDSCFVIRDSSHGFALLFAVLATSVLLAISASIWNIALREIVLSSYGRESQVAFYVADSAIECALYWDFRGTNAFATSSDSLIVSGTTVDSFSTIDCGAGSIMVKINKNSSDNYEIDSLNATSKFSATVGNGCATVLVGKSNPGATSHSATNIESYGQNSCNPSDPTTVERGLRVTY